MTKPDFTIKSVTTGIPELNENGVWGPWEKNRGGFELVWTTESAGFGTTTFVLNHDGMWECDNECMSRDFVMSVLKHWVDNMRFRDDP
jgi:hypothetical protein